MKKVIRLTEGDLHRIIRKSVIRIIEGEEDKTNVDMASGGQEKLSNLSNLANKIANAPKIDLSQFKVRKKGPNSDKTANTTKTDLSQFEVRKNNPDSEEIDVNYQKYINNKLKPSVANRSVLDFFHDFDDEIINGSKITYTLSNPFEERFKTHNKRTLGGGSLSDDMINKLKSLKFTESRIRMIVKESINRIIRESYYNPYE